MVKLKVTMVLVLGKQGSLVSFSIFAISLEPALALEAVLAISVVVFCLSFVFDSVRRAKSIPRQGGFFAFSHLFTLSSCSVLPHWNLEILSGN